MVVEMLRPNICVHCGRPMGDFDGGYGAVNNDHGVNLPLCHPNALDRPDCYHLVTVYHHPVTDCQRCSPEPWEPLTPIEQHDAMIDTLRRLEAMIQDVSP